MRRSLLDLLAPAVFVLGLLLLAFGYGFYASRDGLFPASTLNRAEESARGIWEAYIRPPPFDRPGRDRHAGAVDGRSPTCPTGWPKG